MNPIFIPVLFWKTNPAEKSGVAQLSPRLFIFVFKTILLPEIMDSCTYASDIYLYRWYTPPKYASEYTHFITLTLGFAI